MYAGIELIIFGAIENSECKWSSLYEYLGADERNTVKYFISFRFACLLFSLFLAVFFIVKLIFGMALMAIPMLSEENFPTKYSWIFEGNFYTNRRQIYSARWRHKDWRKWSIINHDWRKPRQRKNSAWNFWK